MNIYVSPSQPVEGLLLLVHAGDDINIYGGPCEFSLPWAETWRGAAGVIRSVRSIACMGLSMFFGLRSKPDVALEAVLPG